MYNIAIRAENLGKQYNIGGLQARYKTIRESIADALAVPSRRWKYSEPESRNTQSDIIWALKHVSFDVKQGEVLGIIGHNGAGKTTLLKILSRITVPTEGRVDLYGRVGSLLEVGTGFHPELTGRENVFLNGAIIGMKQAEISRKFDEIVEFAGVERFLDMPVKRYSSGMRVRLAFAVAAHLEPEILLVDEVLAVGDAAFQKKCLGKMGDVARGGRTVLFVSHNMGAVSRLCERVLWLDGGQIVETGPTNEIIQSYLNVSASTSGTWNNTLIYEAEPKIKLLSASIITEGESQTGVVRFNEGFALEVYYDVLAPVRSWFLMFRVSDSSGGAVFTSWDTDSLSHDEITQPGNYRAVCHVPGKLLRPGIYSVTLLTNARRVGILDHHENAFHFEVSSVGYAMNARRQGAITPVLNWSVTRNRI